MDLRSLGGGQLNEAVEVANLFIKEGTLAQVIGHNDFVKQTLVADPQKHQFGGDLAVMIDYGTAGAAEVIASAVIDSKRGEVIGEKSFGAGTEQELFVLRQRGDGFLLTTAKWASSKGKPFLGEKRSESGVKPTVEVKRPETPEPIEVEELVNRNDDETENQPQKQPEGKNVGEDVQLNKALEILQGKTKAAGAK